MHKLWEGLSFHKTGFRVLKLAHRVDSSMLPTAVLDVALQLVGTYAGLFLSGMLIDALLEGSFEQAAICAAAVVLVNFAVGTADRFLMRMLARQKTRCNYALYTLLREKALSLDYETMEKPEMVDRILLLEKTSAMYGELGEIVGYYQEILKSLLTIATSVGMIVVLCIQRPAAAGGALGLIAAPGCTLLIFAALFAANCVFSGKISSHFSRILKKIFENHAGVENKLAYLMNQIFLNYSAGKVVRIFDMKGMLLQNAFVEIKKERDYYEEAVDVEMGQELSYMLVNGIFSVFSYLVVALKVVTGAVSVGSFTRYVGALNQFGSAYTALVERNGRICNCCTYMQSFLDFLDQESLHVKGTIPVEKRIDGEYEIAFEDVSFHYPGSEETVLEHVSCKLDMKHKMAVVGKNGAGKTTFIKLLCRLYEPSEGRITLNGVDIRKYDEEQYRDILSVVFQDFKLFAFPVWENIAAGYERDDRRLWEALRQAGAEKLVQNMPEGLDTCLYQNTEQGVEISGGEAQKLALARALYKDAALVILDEPTAALDPIAEAEVYARFDEMVKDKTSIYISHRMSSCRFCDDIIVFDRGRIVERGSHEALLEAGGQYAQMWNAQAKYYIDTNAG